MSPKNDYTEPPIYLDFENWKWKLTKLHLNSCIRKLPDEGWIWSFIATFIELQLEDYMENAKALYKNHMQIKSKQNFQDHLLTIIIENAWSIQNPTPEWQEDIGD